MSLETDIAGIPLASCIYNASGPRTTTKGMLVKIGESKSGAVLGKSCTLNKQSGNPMPRAIQNIDLGEGCHGSINSEGLPNNGIDYYISEDLVGAVTATGKPYIVSLSGKNIDENLEMLERACDVDGISAIELNLACPNVPGKPVIAYDFEQMDDVIDQICTNEIFQNSGKILGVKLAPYFDIPHFKRAADIINSYSEFISFVTTMNTIGNALVVDAENEMSAIVPKGGYGGLGGGFVKQTALANVRKMYELLSDDIDIIGVGGVASGTDAFELILCGAKAVQVGTKHWTEGPGCFERISNELKTMMIEKGYSSIEDFRGNLKPYQKGKKKSKTNSRRGKNESNNNNDTAKNILLLLLFVVCGFLIAERQGFVKR
eukprot:g1294.t1